MTSNLCS